MWVVLVFCFWREIGFGVTYVLSVQYSCAVASVFCCGRKANLVGIFLLNPRIFFSYMGIGIRRGWTMDRKLHVDTLIFIPTSKFDVFHIPDIFLVNTLLLNSLSPYRRTESQTEKTNTLATHGLEEPFFQLCCCFSFFSGGK